MFNGYFIAAAIIGHILKSFWMIRFLGWDLLFVFLTSIFWLVPTFFNFVFLLSDDTFKINIVYNHMWFLWTLALVQVIMSAVDWQWQQGDFTKHFKIPVNISSVFITGANIMNYIFQGAL